MTILDSYNLANGDTISDTYTFTGSGRSISIEGNASNLSGYSAYINIESSGDGTNWTLIKTHELPKGTYAIIVEPCEVTGDRVRVKVFRNDSHSGTITITAVEGESEQTLVSWKQAITAAQAATLSSVPVDIADLPASGVGYAWEIISFSVKYTFVTTDYDFAQIMTLTETAHSSTFETQILWATQNLWISGYTSGANGDIAIVENKKVQIKSNADPTTGDGTFMVYGTARKIAL